MKSGYTRRLIDRALKTRSTDSEDEVARKDRGDRQAEQPRRTILCFLPYVEGSSEKIGNICRKYGLIPVFHQWNTLRNILMRVEGERSTEDQRQGGWVQNTMQGMQ
jgi:hypothetical protein